MKKTLSLILALILALSMFVSCGEGGNDIQAGIDEIISSENLEDAVKKFMQFLAEGEYLKASECYTNEVYGNYELESQASDAIIEYCEGINTKVLSGEYTEKDAKNKLGVVDKVIDNASISIPDYNAIASKVNASVASKAAYLAGVELEKLENYAYAITEYKKVVEEDSNYSESVSAIDRCTDLVKSDAYDKADTFVAEKNYNGAIDVLYDVLALLPNDSEILSKITVYEKTHLKAILEDAETAFSSVDKYEDALKVINSGLQYFPDNAELLAKKDYYNSFAPVNIYDMNPLRGDMNCRDVDKDIYGNSYQKCFCVGFYLDDDITYNINKEYNTFSAVVYGRHDANKSWNASVSIYADGKAIYQNLNLQDNNTRPFTIELNVTGVSELRIVMDGNGNGGIGMSNMILRKTVK